MALVTLVMASGPGYPEGSEAHRYEMTITLDSHGCPDAHAWRTDPEPWPARRRWPGEPDLRGDVQHDADVGWWLRFFRDTAQAPDAPPHDIQLHAGPLRPGEMLTIREPDGRLYDWRVVGVQ